MSFKEVNRLRKSGHLEEAAKLSQVDMAADPFDEWNKRGAMWVYYEYMKLAVEKNNIVEFLKQLEKITKLKLPANEKIAFDATAWSIGKLLFANNGVGVSVLDKIFGLIKDFNFTKPKDSYSYLLKAFKKHNEGWINFYEFVMWWGFDNFLSVDYESFVLDNGKKIPSLVESIYIALSKQLLNQADNKKRIEEFLPRIGYISNNYKNMQYPSYYYAKLLLALGDKEHFMQAFLPFAKKKQRDFWVWDLLSDAFDKSSEEYFSCLCKSLSCGAPEKFTGNVREKFAIALIKQQQYSEAKYELERIIETRLNEGWALKPKHSDWQNYSWWNTTQIPRNNFGLYKNNLTIAEGLLYADIAEELMVIERVNKEKTVLNFIVSKKKYGLVFYGKFNIKPQVGEVYAVRFAKSDKPQKSNFYQIQSIALSNQPASIEIYKQVEGRIIIKQGNSFGFVDNVFVPPQVINNYQLMDGGKIKANAVQTFNTRRKAWGWSVINIEK